MRICTFEDSRVLFLEPLTLTRPAFALRLGAETLLERQQRALSADQLGVWVRPELAPLARLLSPGLMVNDPDWLQAGRAVFVNARWLLETKTAIDVHTPHVGVVGEQVAYLMLAEPEVPPAPEQVDDWLASWKTRLPVREAQGTIVDYLWDLVDQNAEALGRDLAWFRARNVPRPLPPQVAVQGPVDRLVLAAGADIEPFATIDTRNGPVLVDEGAVIHAYSRLDGPCYVGKGTWVQGGRVRGGTTLGPVCRIGGDVETSIVQGYTNKQHDGFLGHSYLGEWVNLAAGTQTSDLRNDYGEVRVTVNGQRTATGHNKAGSFIGDHTKTGLGVLLNTGSAIGAFTNLLPTGSLLPTVVPSFCQVTASGLQELWDLRKLFGTAATVMRRRGLELTSTHQEFYDSLYEATAELRRRAVRDSEARRLRRSV
jgi:UDP-N-acetylglucosamine diphosphorylase/glucosamine-1-phosphate N-acetyltransferase